MFCKFGKIIRQALKKRVSKEIKKQTNKQKQPKLYLKALYSEPDTLLMLNL